MFNSLGTSQFFQRWGNYRLPGWALNVITGVRQLEGDVTAEGKGNMTVEAKIGMMCFEDGEK